MKPTYVSVPCKRGHLSARYSTGWCIACARKEGRPPSKAPAVEAAIRKGELSAGQIAGSLGVDRGYVTWKAKQIGARLSGGTNWKYVNKRYRNGRPSEARA